MTKHYRNSAAWPLETKDEGGADLQKTVRDFMSGWDEFKSTNDARLKEVEKKGAADVLFGEKLTRIEGMLSKHEDLNQRLTKAEKISDEMKALDDRFAAVETMLRRSGIRQTDPGETKANHEAFLRAVNVSFANPGALSPEQTKLINDVQAEYKALSVANDTSGGIFAPMEMSRDIIKAVTEISPVRALVEVRQIGGRGITLPKRTGQFAARRVIEQGTKSETTGLAYGAEEIVAPEIFALIDITNDMLEDSVISIEQEVNSEATIQFDKAEGTEFITGTGIGEMEGILVNSSIQTTGFGGAAITGDGLLALKYAVKSDYAKNGTFILNRTSMGQVRQLKETGTGAYLWQPGLAQGRPNTIDGDPYVEVPDMPIAAAAAKPVAYGDFRRAYTLVDRLGMTILRDQYTQAGSGKVRYIMRRRVGGKVRLAEAIRLGVCS